jgi:hypothetical protein
MIPDRSLARRCADQNFVSALFLDELRINSHSLSAAKDLMAIANGVLVEAP